MKRMIKKIIVAMMACVVMCAMCACKKDTYNTEALKDVNVLGTTADNSSSAEGDYVMDEHRQEQTDAMAIAGEVDAEQSGYSSTEDVEHMEYAGNTEEIYAETGGGSYEYEEYHMEGDGEAGGIPTPEIVDIYEEGGELWSETTPEITDVYEGGGTADLSQVADIGGDLDIEAASQAIDNTPGEGLLSAYNSILDGTFEGGGAEGTASVGNKEYE